MASNAQHLRAFRQRLGLDKEGMHRPQDSLINAAAQAVPTVMRDMDSDPILGDPDPKADQKAAFDYVLVSRLQEQGHTAAAAVWAVYALIERGLLDVEIRKFVFKPIASQSEKYRFIKMTCTIGQVRPAVASQPPLDGSTSSKRSPRAQLHSHVVVLTTPDLWDWWCHSPEATLTLPSPRKQDGSKTKGPRRRRAKREKPTDREVRAYALSLQGKTYTEIASQMGISRQGATVLVKKAKAILWSRGRSGRALQSLPVDRRGQHTIADRRSTDSEDSE
jgi:DNA-binding CsgD family transcriptional regulator